MDFQALSNGRAVIARSVKKGDELRVQVPRIAIHDAAVCSQTVACLDQSTVGASIVMVPHSYLYNCIVLYTSNIPEDDPGSYLGLQISFSAASLLMAVSCFWY